MVGVCARILVFWSALAVFAGDVFGQGGRPASAQREVARFGFEEPDNPRDLPYNWVRAQDDPGVRTRPGFPIYNQARLDFGVAYSGEASVRLPTRGGSTSLRLNPGVVPVFPGADYRIGAMVRTEGLRRSRARFVVRFLDSDGAPIGASESRSELIRTSGRWERVVVDLRGDHRSAAFIQVDLELLQEERFEENAIGSHRVWIDDVEGDAWFDEISIAQLPRIELHTDAPANIVAAPETPELRLVVRDLTGEGLRADIGVRDIAGHLVDVWGRDIGSGKTSAHWSPALPAYGWYRAIVTISNDERTVGEAWCEFVWLPESVGHGGSEQDAGRPASMRAERERFGLIVRDMPERLEGLIPGIASRIGVGTVTIPAVDAGTTAANARARLDRLTPMIDALLGMGSVTLSVPRVPDEVARLTQVDDPLSLLGLDETAWGSVINPFLDRYGQRIARWQLGAIGDTRAVRSVDVGERAGAAHGSLAHLVPGPIVKVPWSPVYPPAEAGGSVVVWDTGLWLESMRAFVDAWREDAPPGEVAVAHRLPDWDEMSPGDAAAQLVKHTVEFWRGMPKDVDEVSGPTARTALIEPWGWSTERRPQLTPRPELAVWRTLADRLSGRDVVGEITTVPGVRCYILGPSDRVEVARAGALVLWREGAAPDEGLLELHLGDGDVKRIDPFGNATPVPADTTDETGRVVHRLYAETMPAFIEGVDLELVRFIASVRVEPGFLAAKSIEHEATLRFENTWGEAISGRYFLVSPGGRDESGVPDRSWIIRPRHGTFSLAPGEAAEIPITVAFGQSLDSGKTKFVFDIEVSADREYGIVRVQAPVEVGLERVKMDLTYRLFPETDGPHLAVEARITNISDEDLVLVAEAIAPGFARIRRSVSGLPPGEQVVRRFEYENGASLVGSRVAVRLSDVEAEQRLPTGLLIE